MDEGASQAAAAPGRSRRFALWTIVLLAAALVVSLSGILTDRPMDTHEIFAAQTAREMIAGGDWVRPTFNDKPRLNKPPLQYWLIAGLAAATGQGAQMPPWVARSASLLAGLGLVVVAMRLGRAVFDARDAIGGTALLIGSIAFFEYTNSARAEMLYALTCAGVLACFVRAHDAADRSRGQRLWALGAWAWVGISVLAKGPHVPLLLMTGFALAMAFAIGARRRVMRVLRPLSGIPVAALICLPWIVVMIRSNPGMVDHWWQQLFADRPPDEKLGIWNYLSPFYLYMFPAMLLPVSVLIPFGIAAPLQRARPDLRRGWLLLGPILFTILVMSFFTHRRDYYLLGLAAPTCILCARGLRDFLERRTRIRPDLVVAGISVVCILAITIAGRTRVIWDDARWRRADFARRIVEQVGDDPVLFYRADPDAYVYFLSRPIAHIRQPEALLAAVGNAPAWVVLSEKHLGTLPTPLTAETALKIDTGDSDDPPLVLARLGMVK